MTFKNIFTEFIDTENFKINLPRLKNHILDVREKMVGRQVSNCGGWQSEVFITPNTENKLLFNKIDKQVQQAKEKINFLLEYFGITQVFVYKEHLPYLNIGEDVRIFDYT